MIGMFGFRCGGRVAWTALSLTFVVGHVASGLAQDQAKAAIAELPTVAVSQPVEREVTDFETFAGRAEAVESVHVASRVTGYFTNAAFKEGSDVKKRDLLFEIDPRPYQALVDQAQAEVRLHETRMAAARVDLDRAKELVKSAAISRGELDKYQAAEQEAAAALDAAKASLQLHELNLGFCRIVSPIDGRAGRYNLTAGNLVTQDQTELTTIISLDPISAVFNMDERTLLRIRKANNESKLKQLESGGAMPVFLQAQGEDDFSRQGTVNFVSNQRREGDPWGIDRSFHRRS